VTCAAGHTSCRARVAIRCIGVLGFCREGPICLTRSRTSGQPAAREAGGAHHWCMRSGRAHTARGVDSALKSGVRPTSARSLTAWNSWSHGPALREDIAVSGRACGQKDGSTEGDRRLDESCDWQPRCHRPLRTVRPEALRPRLSTGLPLQSRRPYVNYVTNDNGAAEIV